MRPGHPGGASPLTSIADALALLKKLSHLPDKVPAPWVSHSTHQYRLRPARATSAHTFRPCSTVTRASHAQQSGRSPA